MKLFKYFAAAVCAAACCTLAACTTASTPDAGALVREAATLAGSMKSCSATVSDELVFTANGKQMTQNSQTELVYFSDPFALKSVQTVTDGSETVSSETYTLTENNSLYFYCKTSSGWQKSSVENLDTTCFSQIGFLSLLNESTEQKYVRDTTVGSRNVRKIELKLESEALRSTIENIVTLSGMGGSSKTIVQTLLDSAPDVYGYCYVDTENGQPLRIEMDASDALNKIFQGISGSSVTVKVTKCVLTGELSDIGSAAEIVLPEEARSATSVQAKG